MLLTACAPMQPPDATGAVDDPEGFLQGLVGHWNAVWRSERLKVDGVLVADTLWLLRASPPDPSQDLPHNPVADTLGQFWISEGALMGRNPGFAHDNSTDLCYISEDTWAPCTLPPSGWRTQFISADSIHIGESDEARAILYRTTPGHAF